MGGGQRVTQTVLRIEFAERFVLEQPGVDDVPRREVDRHDIEAKKGDGYPLRVTAIRLARDPVLAIGEAQSLDSEIIAVEILLPFVAVGGEQLRGELPHIDRDRILGRDIVIPIEDVDGGVRITHLGAKPKLARGDEQGGVHAGK